MNMRLLLGLTQLPEVKNNQLILLLIRARLQPLYDRKGNIIQHKILILFHCRQIAPLLCLPAHAQKCLLVHYRSAWRDVFELPALPWEGTNLQPRKRKKQQENTAFIEETQPQRVYRGGAGGGSGRTFNPLTELMQVVHGAGLAQFDLGLRVLQCCSCAEGLLHGQHHLIYLRGGHATPHSLSAFLRGTAKPRVHYMIFNILTEIFKTECVTHLTSVFCRISCILSLERTHQVILKRLAKKVSDTVYIQLTTKMQYQKVYQTQHCARVLVN